MRRTLRGAPVVTPAVRRLALLGGLLALTAAAAPGLVFDQARDARQTRAAFSSVLPEMASVLYSASASKLDRVPIQGSNLALTLSSADVQERDFRTGALLGRINRATDLAFLKSSVSNITVRIVNTAVPDQPRRVATYGVDNPVFLKLRRPELLIGPFGSDPTTYDTGWTRQDPKRVLAFIDGPDLHLRLCDGLLCARSPLGQDEIKVRWERALGPSYTLITSNTIAVSSSYWYCGAAGASVGLLMYRTALSDTTIDISAGNRCP